MNAPGSDRVGGRRLPESSPALSCVTVETLKHARGFPARRQGASARRARPFCCKRARVMTQRDPRGLHLFQENRQCRAATAPSAALRAMARQVMAQHGRRLGLCAGRSPRCDRQPRFSPPWSPIWNARWASCTGVRNDPDGVDRLAAHPASTAWCSALGWAMAAVSAHLFGLCDGSAGASRRDRGTWLITSALAAATLGQFRLDPVPGADPAHDA